LLSELIKYPVKGVGRRGDVANYLGRPTQYDMHTILWSKNGRTGQQHNNIIISAAVERGLIPDEG